MTYPGAVVVSSNRVSSGRSIGTRSSDPDKRYTSDSWASSYNGSPLSVFRVIDGDESDQPKPNGPFAPPESYDSESVGPKPPRPGLTGRGTVRDPVPST